jgi:hypothetical protein
MVIAKAMEQVQTFILFLLGIVIDADFPFGTLLGNHNVDFSLHTQTFTKKL